MRSTVGEFAGAMHDDLIDAVDRAVARGHADPDRIGILGGSYGGYAALVGVTVYLVAEDEGHGFENRENQLMLFRAIERHPAEHLGGRSAATG